MTVIRQSRVQRDGLFGILDAVFLLALVRGYTGASTTSGRIAVVIFLAAVIIAWTGLWIRMIRRPSVLEVSADAVTLVPPRGDRRTLSRAAGNEILVTVTGGGRYRSTALTIAGSGVVLPVGFFDIKEIQRQCVADGWQFSRAGRRRLA